MYDNLLCYYTHELYLTLFTTFWMTHVYSVSQNTLRISIFNYIRLVKRIDLILFLNFWYIYEILFFTLLLIIGGLQAKLY